MYCYLIFFTYILIISSESELNTGVCRRNDSTGFENFCCDDYEPKSDDKSKCQECRPGFTSMKGRPCYECKKNSFGKKCSSKCNCSRSEICHNVNGCVAETQTQSAVTSASFDTRSSEMGLYHQTSTGVRFTDEYKGWLTREKMLTYIMSTGLCAVSIGLLVICRKRGTQCFYRIKRKHKTSVNNELRNQVVNEEILQMSDSIYDLIDDQNMIDNHERTGKK